MYGAMMICRKCGSLKVDVKCWIDRVTCIVRCTNCDNEAELRGFTLGRIGIGGEMQSEALSDAAFPRVI